MKLRVIALVIASVPFALALHLHGADRPAAGGKKKTGGEERDFGDKVLLVVIRPSGTLQLGTACIEKARVRVLGDRHFVTGRVPDYGAPGQVNIGDVLWIPMSEVVMISEHASAKAALKSAPGIARPVPEPPKPDNPKTEPGDVTELPTRAFRMPVILNPALKGKAETIRVFVSTDRGQTWKHERDCKPADETITFVAPEDGLYWFDAQVVLKDGTRVPGQLADLSPSQKVLVNTTGRRTGAQKSNADLERENQDLRRRVEELQQKLRSSERESRPAEPGPTRGPNPWTQPPDPTPGPFGPQHRP